MRLRRRTLDELEWILYDDEPQLGWLASRIEDIRLARMHRRVAKLRRRQPPPAVATSPEMLLLASGARILFPATTTPLPETIADVIDVGHGWSEM